MRAGARAPGPGNVFTVFALLKRPGVMLGMLASSLFFMGQFSLFTYVRPFLRRSPAYMARIFRWYCW